MDASRTWRHFRQVSSAANMILSFFVRRGPDHKMAWYMTNGNFLPSSLEQSSCKSGFHANFASALSARRYSGQDSVSGHAGAVAQGVKDRHPRDSLELNTIVELARPITSSDKSSYGDERWPLDCSSWVDSATPGIAYGVMECLETRTSATGRDGSHWWKARPFSNLTCFAKGVGWLGDGQGCFCRPRPRR